MSRTPAGVLGVEGRHGRTQEAGLEDVAAAAVGEEAALVQIHLLPGGLEVQRHCMRGNTAVKTTTPTPEQVVV